MKISSFWGEQHEPSQSVPPDLWIIIPCHNEPDLLGTLNALVRAHSPASQVGVVVVINESERAQEAISTRNRETWQEARAWAAQALPFAFYVLYVKEMPHKHAGVGLARRIGMDWAAGLALTGLPQWPSASPERLLINLDADCRVDANYFQALEQHFQAHPQTPGASLYYEHPLDGPLDPALYQGICHYELFLRYYVHALRWAGFPWAYQTVGSAMAVRSDVYIKVGGMNRRKAGEDFYFLNKVIEQGNFSEVRSTCVRPSPRVSERVPFGTGKAMQDWLRGPQKGYPCYPLQGFIDLRQCVADLPQLYTSTESELELRISQYSQVLSEFLIRENAVAKIQEIRANVASAQAFEKRFFQWFNAFRVMKALHFFRDRAYGSQSLVAQARRLARSLNWDLSHLDDGKADQQQSQTSSQARSLLQLYRLQDRLIV